MIDQEGEHLKDNAVCGKDEFEIQKNMLEMTGIYLNEKGHNKRVTAGVVEKNSFWSTKWAGAYCVYPCGVRGQLLQGLMVFFHPVALGFEL